MNEIKEPELIFKTVKMNNLNVAEPPECSNFFENKF